MMIRRQIRSTRSSSQTRSIPSAGMGRVELCTAASVALLLSSSPALATGLESMDIIGAPPVPESWKQAVAAQKQVQREDDERFKQSDTLKQLLEKSKANKEKNKREVANKYCFRQAELGIGDCGGLNLIPGLTDNGKQETPQWLADLLGVEVPKSARSEGKTLKDLIEGPSSPIQIQK
jgi:hypothetical protein